MGDSVRPVLDGSLRAGLDGIMTRQGDEAGSENLNKVETDLADSMVETVLGYVEAGDISAAREYMTAMSLEGIEKIAKIMGALYDLIVEQGKLRFPVVTEVKERE